jgi:hypothetical protein
MPHVISVCHREADSIEYLHYKLEYQQRFVVRSMISRHIEEADGKLHLYGRSLQSTGERQVDVVQKGGHKARTAICDVRFAPVTLKMPSNKKGQSTKLYYVSCIERSRDDGLCWHLLTSEPVTTKEQAFIAVRIQQLRHLDLQKELAGKQSSETLPGPKAWKLLCLKVEKS